MSLNMMMFGDVSCSEDPDFSTYGIIRAQNRKGMQEVPRKLPMFVNGNFLQCKI